MKTGCLIAVFLAATAIKAMPKAREGQDGQGNTRNNLEIFQAVTTETKEGYETREYPPSKWVCTKATVDPSEDPINDWQTTFDNNALEVMDSNVFEDSVHGEMFQKLFRYIAGVNSDYTEIEMTAPVTGKMIRLIGEGLENKWLHEMCFWTGSEWQDKELPKPIDPEVYISEREGFQVYVRQFSGWALSYNDWLQEYEQLQETLKENDIEYDSTVFYSAGYDSPFILEERRNEIWIPKSNVASLRVEQEQEDENERDEISYEVLRTEDTYELRKYPASKWVCTQITDHKINDDTMKDWQKKYENAYEAMSAKKSKERNSPKSKMFRYLYQYISGVNEGFHEIEMTSPVTKKHVVKEDGVREDIEMCFWTGSEWEDKEVPKPLKKEVYLQDREELYVYVRRFGGWALSYDDWHKEHVQLVEDLGEDTKYIPNVYYTVGYQSPWVSQDRRNEVWLPVEREDVEQTQEEDNN